MKLKLVRPFYTNGIRVSVIDADTGIVQGELIRRPPPSGWGSKRGVSRRAEYTFHPEDGRNEVRFSRASTIKEALGAAVSK